MHRLVKRVQKAQLCIEDGEYREQRDSNVMYIQGQYFGLCLLFKTTQHPKIVNKKNRINSTDS